MTVTAIGLAGRLTIRHIKVKTHHYCSGTTLQINASNYYSTLVTSSHSSPWPFRSPFSISASAKYPQLLLPQRTFLSSSFRLAQSELQSQSKASKDTPKTSAENDVKDLVIYEQGTPDYFKKLSFLSVLQLIFFGVTAFTFGGLRDAPIKKPSDSDTGEQAEETQETHEEIFDKLTVRETPTPESEDLPFWRRINLGDPKVKFGLQNGAIALGYIFLLGTWVFIFRHVHFIVLRKDPRSATLVTYAPFGRHRYVDVLVNEVSAEGSRQDRLFPSMKLRVKGHAMTYKIDLRNGRFRRPELFDSTVGRRRNFD